MNATRGAVGAELSLQWRGYVIPILGLVVVLLAIANLGNEFNAVHENYRELLQAKAEYAAHGMDFDADLAKPVHSATVANGTGSSNIARESYDALTQSLDALSPANGPAEVLKYLGIFLFPAIAFVVATQLASYGRRTGTDKYRIVRLGPVRTFAAKQLAAIVVVLGLAGVAVVCDEIGRILLAPIARSQIPLRSLTDLDPLPHTDWWLAAPALAMVWCFYSALGFLFGVIAKGVAIPAIVFLVYNYIVPVVGVFDPRSWVATLARQLFDYTTGSFAIFSPEPIPVVESIALIGSSFIVAISLSLLVSLRRNPAAT